MIDSNIIMNDGNYYCQEKFPFTTKIIEEQVSKFIYNISGMYKDDAVEKENLFPPFTAAFHSMCFWNARVMSPVEFMEKYLAVTVKEHVVNENSQEKQVVINCSGIDKAYSLAGMQRRLMQMYPSLVRDLHFYCMCQESKYFEHVHYSTRSDLSGKDVSVTYKGKVFPIALFADTPDGVKYAKIKQTIKHDIPNLISIPFTLSDPNKLECGQIYLYSKWHLENLMSQIQSKL